MRRRESRGTPDGCPSPPRPGHLPGSPGRSTLRQARPRGPAARGSCATAARQDRRPCAPVMRSRRDREARRYSCRARDEVRLGRRADLGFGDTWRTLHQPETFVCDIQDGQVGDDAVDDALTGERVVHRIITDLAVLDVTDEGLRLVECAPGVTEAEVRAATEPDLISGPA